MVGVLIVSHGGLAEALISEVQSLIGKLQKVKGVSIWPIESEKEIRDRIREKMKEVDDGDGVVILTDILGGTPTNLCLYFTGSCHFSTSFISSFPSRSFQPPAIP